MISSQPLFCCYIEIYEQLLKKFTERTDDMIKQLNDKLLGVGLPPTTSISDKLGKY